MNQRNLTLIEHFIEIRKRITWCVLFFLFAFGMSYIFSKEIYNFLLQPLIKAYGDNLHDKRMIFTSLTEAFTTYLRLSFLAALFFSTPFFLSQIYFFVAPGLYKNEKRVILSLMIAAPLLFLCGALLLYYLVLPLAFEFFISFEIESLNNIMPIQLEARVSQYLSLVTDLTFAFGIAFQLPIILILLVKIGLLSTEKLKSQRKYWIVLIFVIAAILTPPDILSQIALAIPMMMLYEIAIIISYKITRRR